jgi:hypothetical protein
VWLLCGVPLNSGVHWCVYLGCIGVVGSALEFGFALGLGGFKLGFTLGFGP